MTIPYERHNKQQANLLEITSSFDLTILKDKPFWIWNKEEHYKKARESITSAAGGEGRVLPPSPSCCFNHIVGLPQKDGKEYPLFDYEKLLYDSPLGIDGFSNIDTCGLRKQLGWA